MSDLVLYHARYDTAGLMAEIKDCINIAFDILSGKMHDVLCTVISQCSEAAGVMILEAQKNVREISREITNDHATIEVGIEEGAIGGGVREYIRVMVTLHGNGEVWARAHGTGWTKYVNSQHQNHVETDYRLSFFEQSDHSETMMKSFEHDMKRHTDDFMDRLTGMLNAIDYSKYLIIS